MPARTQGSTRERGLCAPRFCITSKGLDVLFCDQKDRLAAGRDGYGVRHGLLRRRRRRRCLQGLHGGEMKLGDPVEWGRSTVRSTYDFGGNKSLDALEGLRSDHRRMILCVDSLEGLNIPRCGVENDEFRAGHGLLLLHSGTR